MIRTDRELALVVLLFVPAGVLCGQSENNPFGNYFPSRETTSRAPALSGSSAKYATRLTNVQLLRQVQQGVHDMKMDTLRHKQELRTARVEDYKHRTTTGFAWLQARGDRTHLSSAIRLGPQIAPATETAPVESGPAKTEPVFTEPISYRASGSEPGLIGHRTEVGLAWPKYFTSSAHLVERRLVDHCVAKVQTHHRPLTADELVALHNCCDLLLSRLNADAKTLDAPTWLAAKKFLAELQTLLTTI